jgi:TatD DNase family protein
MPVPYYDAHTHLHDEWLAPHWGKISAQLPALGLHRAVVNGTHEADWPRVGEMSRQTTWITPSFGLHPWHAGGRADDWFSRLTAALDATPGAVIGEIGLDRWILERARPDDPRLAGLRRAPLEEQTAVFAQQLALAAARESPATIHCLDAWGPLLEQLRAARALPSPGFLLHAYGGPPELINAFADLGAYFSFNGSFLDERRSRQRETFRHIPADRLLIETDAPAMPLPPAWCTHKLPLSPDGQRINHPGNIEATYTGLAAFLGEPVSTLAARVEENFLRLFSNRTSR